MVYNWTCQNNLLAKVRLCKHFKYVGSTTFLQNIITGRDGRFRGKRCKIGNYAKCGE